MTGVKQDLMMWITFAFILAVVVSYVWEYYSLEFTSLTAITVLLILFEFFTMNGADGTNTLGAIRLLARFVDPALITILCMLVIGQGLVQTGALQRIARDIIFLAR